MRREEFPTEWAIIGTSNGYTRHYGSVKITSPGSVVKINIILRDCSAKLNTRNEMIFKDIIAAINSYYKIRSRMPKKHQCKTYAKGGINDNKVIDKNDGE